MIWLTVIVFVVILLALVLVHEWGHFIAAKRAGCAVEEFGFGFPPRLLGRKWRGTLYSLNLLPIGGFVKIEGEDMTDPHPGPKSFAAKSATWRVIILAAGVVMNVVLAAVLLAWQGVVGVPTLVTDENAAQLTHQQTYILEVAPNSPAAAAGLQELDRIVMIAGQQTATVENVQAIIEAHAGQEIVVEVERQGVHEELTLVPRVDPPPNEGALGVSLAATGLVKVPWWQAIPHGIERTRSMLVEILRQFGLILQRLVSQGSVGTNLTGPVGIAVYTNEVTQLGLAYVLEFAALISLNLAIINILPLPALDGGRIVFVLLEKILGRRIPGRIEQITHGVGFAALILLMILITFRDVGRFF